jgi:caffeoyl-CoA O-methyltransferase
MVVSVARVVTDQPERYVKQLVSHLGHKLTTELLPGGGVIHVAGGRCVMTVSAGVLVLDASAPDPEALLRVRDVVGRHLERFGARAGLRVQWSDVTPAAGGGGPPVSEPPGD